MDEYFCPKCGAILNDQPRFDSNGGTWTCTSCGELLMDDDVYNGDSYEGVAWFCDECGALLNRQSGFSDSYESWTCTECGHRNGTTDDNIINNEDEYSVVEEDDRLTCPNCGAILEDQFCYASYEDDWKCTECGSHLRHDYSSELYWIVDEDEEDTEEVDNEVEEDEEEREPVHNTSSYGVSTARAYSSNYSSEPHRPYTEPRRPTYSHSEESRTDEPEQNKGKPQPSQKKKRIVFSILFFVNAFFLAVGLLNVFSGKALSFLPTVTAFAILTIFFFLLSKTPKKSKRIFGKSTGMNKWLFVLLCLVALQVLPRAVSAVLDIASNIPTERSITASSRYTSMSSSDVNYVYDLVLTGEAVITDYVGEETSISIPSELDGHPVIRVANRAFENCTTIESISMWADIDSIDDYAFVGCSNLRRISIPSSTKKIGAHAFENCTALTDVTFWNAGSIEEYAFAGCTALSAVSIPSNTRIVGAHAFEGCIGITALTILEAEIIDEYAFAGCTGITRLSIPSDTKTIAAHAFDGCVSLEDVTMWGDETAVHETAFDNCPKLEK